MLQGILGTILTGGSDEQFKAQQATEKRKTMTMVLIAFGILVIGVVAFVTLKK